MDSNMMSIYRNYLYNPDFKLCDMIVSPDTIIISYRVSVQGSTWNWYIDRKSKRNWRERVALTREIR